MRLLLQRAHPWLLAPCVLAALFAVDGAHALEPAGPHSGYPPAPADEVAERVSPDGVEVAGWNAGATRTPSDPAAWGGERPSFGGDGQPLSQRVASYDLRATLDPAKHTVDGTEHLRWLNRSDRPIKSLYFHLYLNAFEGPESTFMKEKALYGAFRSDVRIEKGEWGYVDLKSVTLAGKPAAVTFVHPDGGPSTDRTVVRVDLPEAVAAGTTAELDIVFHDQLPRVVARTGYFDRYHLVAQWFPKVGVLELPGERGATEPRWNCHEFHLFSEFYADFGNYRGELTAPKDYLVRATGVEQGPPEDGPGGRTHTFAQDDVHDFVWTAWDGYAEPLKGVYDGPGSPHVDVEVLYPPEYAESGRAALGGTVDALRYFSATLGPYPYPHVTVVVPPFNAMESGGMEYETFFTTIGSNGIFGGATRYVTVHEFGHGYFMGLLASNEFEEPFLDEGMNETWDARMLAAERLQLHLPATLELLGLKVPDLAYWDVERTRGTQRFEADPIAGSSWDRFSSGSYGLVYGRTALVFHDLEKRLGGDAFARGMKLYYRRWHHRHPATADLREALAEGTGQPDLVRQWFDEQVYGRAPVDDRVTTVESREVVPEAGMVGEGADRHERTAEEVAAEIAKTRDAWKDSHKDAKPGDPGPYPFESRVVLRRYAARVPQRLVVMFEDGRKETIAVPAEERWHRYTFQRPSKVKSAQLDPDGDVLLDLDKLDDGRTREGDHTTSTRWSLEVSSAMQLLASLMVSQ
ncbi:MAG TPA: M1 family metallopeptidase [Polyangiaceae bacterium]